MHIGDRMRYFCNRKISAIQTKHNSRLRHETQSFCEGSVMHGPREEVGGGQVARTHLENHKFYREYTST